MLFWKAVEEFRAKEFDVIQALFIFNTFVTPEARLEINIRHRIKTRLHEAFDHGDNLDEKIFYDAQNAVLRLLAHDSFRRLKELAVFQKYWDERKLKVAARQSVNVFVELD